ncbi:MAG: hypothetical protein V1859_06630 [archaeon]
MADNSEKIIAMINSELNLDHMHALKKVKGMYAKKEEQRIFLEQRLLALKERYKMLLEAIPKLNSEINMLQKENDTALKHYKSNEQKQEELKKIIFEKQKLLHDLIRVHTSLVDEMRDRNKKESTLMNKTERIMFYKNQLSNLIKKTKLEMAKTESDIAFLAKEEHEIDENHLPQQDKKNMIKQKKKK